MPEPAGFASFGPETSHVVAEQTLRDLGWTSCGAGDWAIALRSPSGEHAARISPFDPAAGYCAAFYREAVHTGQVPTLEAEIALDGGANLLLMDFLRPVDPGRASAFHVARAARRPHLAALAELLADVHSRALRELPWCGPLDTNPANVMENPAGRLVLIDPFYADGPNLYAAVLDDPGRVATSIPSRRRRHMFELPLAHSGPADPVLLQRMRDALTAADNALS